MSSPKKDWYTLAGHLTALESNPSWPHYRDELYNALNGLVESLTQASDPPAIYRIQGKIQMLREMLALPATARKEATAQQNAVS